MDAITTVNNDARRGWFARTDFELGDARLLRIETDKCNGGVSTEAKVYTHERGILSHAYSLTGRGGDFRTSVAVSASRATERSVRGQHAAVLQDLDGIKARVLAHYARAAQPV